MPNNGTPAVTTYSVTITNATNNPGAVITNINPTIANLTIGAAESASLNNSQSLTIAGGAGAGSLNIAGTLALGATVNNTDLILGGTSGSTITLSGGGVLSLSGSSANRIYSTTGDTLVNSLGNTIQGSGQIGMNNSGFGFTLSNNAVIHRRQSAPPPPTPLKLLPPCNGNCRDQQRHKLRRPPMAARSNRAGDVQQYPGIILAVGNDGSGQ